MNRSKLSIIVFVCIIVTLGFLLIKAKDKNNSQITNNASSSTKTTEGAPVVTEAAQEEMKKESYTSGLSLQISQPEANATVTSSTVTVKGKTSPNAEVFVNDQELKSDSTGNFTATITLDEGENPIIVVANDADGNSAEQQILVTYQP